MACAVDGDCPGASLCYSNASWYTLGGSGCLCSTWYGFSSPPNCFESDTPTAHFWLGSAICLIIFAFFEGLLSIYNAFVLARASNVGLKDAAFTANVQISLTFILITIHQVITAVEVENPMLVTKGISSTAQKTATTQIPREIVFVFAVTLVIMAALTIALVWLEVGERARKMAHRAAETMIPRTRRFVVIAEVTFLLAMAILCAASVASYAVVVGIVAIVVVLAVYALGFFKLYTELKAVSSVAAESNKIAYRDIIKEIRHTVIGIVVSALGLLVVCLIILIYGLSDWKQYAAPGTVPSVIIAWQMLVVLLLILGSNLLYAIRKATKRKLVAAKTSDFSGMGPAEVQAGDAPGLRTDMDTAGSSVMKSPTAITVHQEEGD